jgi:hypothetical protein
MKKWLILGIVALLAMIYGMQVLMRGRQAELVPAPGPGTQAQQGVALPSGAGDAGLPDSQYAAEAGLRASSTYGSMLSMQGQIYDKEFCPGVSFNKILSDHGRVWGHTAKAVSFSPEESKRVYTLLSRYVACSGLARKDPNTCDHLPGEGEGVKFYASPNYACRGEYTEVSFGAYASGKEKSDLPCEMFLYGDIIKDSGINKPEFCGAAVTGLGNMCEALVKHAPKVSLAQCRSIFPAANSDCNGDALCLNRRGIHQAFKAGNPASCPKGYQQMCEAYAKGTSAPCADLLAETGEYYCATMGKLQKKTGGFAGFTEEESKALIAEQAKKKKEEEELLKQTKAIDEQVSKRAKELMKGR